MHRIVKVVSARPWDALAVFGAAATWGLWCALGGAPSAVTTHAVSCVGLAVLYRLAAIAHEREAHAAPVLHRLGGLGLALAMLSSGALGGLVAGTVVEWGLSAIGTFTPAQASFLPLPPHSGTSVLGILGLAVGVGLILDGYLRGHRALAVTEVTVTLRDLPPALDGIRLAHLSDIHLGPLTHGAALRQAIDRVLALRPDAIVVTGDIADSARTDLAHWLPEMDRLAAPHGVYAILGNHDDNFGLERAAEAVRRHTSWRLLRDEIATLTIREHRLHLIGLDYRSWTQAGQAVGELVRQIPHGEASILLAHFPSAFDAAVAAKVPLTLCGHTHGGQVSWPGMPRLNPARLFMTPYDGGTFREGESLLHVSRGLGTSVQRLRIATPREITVVTLRSPELLHRS